MRLPLEQIAKPLPVIALSLAAFPLLVILGLVEYGFTAWLDLGHWPSSANPDPKQLGWWPQHAALQLGLGCFPVVSMLAVCLAILGRIRSRDFPFWTVISTIVVCMALLVAYAWIDPGGLVVWLWD